MLKKTPKPIAESFLDTLATPPRWQKWVTGIGVGSFVLAAVGMMFYAFAIKRVEPSFGNLKPYFLGILLVTVILMVLEFGRRQLAKVTGNQWIGGIIGVGYAILALCVGFLGVLWLTLFVLQDSGVIARRVESPAPPQVALEQFEYVTCETYASSELPDAIFGSMTDLTGKPRNWMDIHELGAKAKMKDPRLLSLWLLTPEFKNPIASFTEHVYVGTSEGIEIDAYLVRHDGNLQTMRLLQVQGQGPKDEYLFNTPQSKSGDRLLVFIGIKKETYLAIQANPKFLIRSKPR